MAGDGIQPPPPAFSGPRTSPLRECADLDCGWSFALVRKVVARDGIEPPTPAFSGPRSTTELSGLSANFGCISTRGFRTAPDKEGNSTYSSLQQL